MSTQPCPCRGCTIAYKAGQDYRNDIIMDALQLVQPPLTEEQFTSLSQTLDDFERHM